MIIPYDIEAEKNVLGYIIADPEKVVDIELDESDFYSTKHKKIFIGIKKLIEMGREITPISIVDITNKEIKPGYIAELLDFWTPNYKASEEIIKEKSLARKMIKLSMEMQNQINTATNINEILNKFQSDILSLSYRENERREKTLRAIVKESFDRIEKITTNPQHINGIPTGFFDLDKLTGGFQKSDLIIIAARPSMGKTAFVLDIVRNAAEKGNKIGLFSLEMSHQQLGDRFIAAVSNINLIKLRNGYLTPAEFDSIVKYSQEKLWNLQVVVDDSGDLSLDEILVRGMRMWKKYQVDMIAIDYLQLIRAKGRSRHEEISLIANKLKHLAKTINVPVILVSQLNREVEKRNNKRPIMADIKESGDVEQTADLVIFIYRDEYYDKSTAEPNIAEIYVAKQRNGPTGMVRLFWDKRSTTFNNLNKEAINEV
jgi:replicative DNA helicase